MFIRKILFERLMFRLAEMEKAIEEHDDELFAMSESLTELGNKTTEAVSALCDRLTELEDEAESVAEERKRDKDFFDSFSNIMNYEVSNGQKQTQ